VQLTWIVDHSTI